MLTLGTSFSPHLTYKPHRFSFHSVSKLKPLDRRSSRTTTIERNMKNGICRAELSHDAPFAMAIGACMLSSLILPDATSTADEVGDSALDTTDTRFAAMGIISFIPYFNWLTWVFAWLDTGKRRYAIYALVYLAPYLRTNLSLSPEESWLPIASIVFGIIHVQLEASIRNGDFEEFQLFKKERKGEQRNLPSAEEQSRNEIRQWRVPRKPSEHGEHSNGDWVDDDERMKQ